ncbi:MAG: N-acetylglucosamine-6-phosphate deacetylase [Pyrinomonadaceae bacterium]
MQRTDPEPRSMLLRSTRIILPDEAREDASLLIRGGRIATIYKSTKNETTPADAVLNLDGLTLLPGFIDVHIHGAAGVDTMDASGDDLHRVARFLATRGVTAWLPTFVPAPDADYVRATKAVEELITAQDQSRTTITAARALGLHYEGPFVNVAQCGALRIKYFRTFTDARDVAALPVLNSKNAAHMITVAPEVEGGIKLVRELRRRGWIVSIGHTRAGVEILDQACDAGAHHMTHFPNAMLALHHRAAGPIGWGLLRDDVTCDVIADGVHCDASMLRLILKCKTAERVALISDAVAPAGLGDGEYDVWGETIKVTDGRTSNARGSIAGSVIAMDDAVRRMLALDVQMIEATRMASLNPARLLGVERNYGSIETGKRADLVALDEDGRVRLTIIGGRIAFDATQIAAEENI